MWTYAVFVGKYKEECFKLILNLKDIGRETTHVFVYRKRAQYQAFYLHDVKKNALKYI